MTKKYVPKKRASAKSDWRKMLKQVVSRLNKHDEGAVQLWDVLSALRGPDNADVNDKQSTTGVIRKKAGLTYGGPSWAVVNEDTPEYARRRSEADLKITAIHYHFQVHAAKAFSALGLKWGKVNQ